MPASLVSDWKRIAQSGPTVDGRFIKPEWLTDMAETYDPEVYTAKLWVDHMRYASYGSVRDLKAEEDGDVVRLYARISPSRSLLQMNMIWEEKLHFSIEPTEDFAKTGKCYLTGLGMTDSPASLGTDEMRFSKIPGRDYTARFAGEPVPDLREVENEDRQIETFMGKLARVFTSYSQTEEKNDMDEKKFEALESTVEDLKTVVGGIAEQFKKFVDNGKDDDGKGPGKPEEEPAQNEQQFTELHTSVTTLTEKFDKLVERLEKLAPSTQFEETTSPADDKDELL